MTSTPLPPGITTQPLTQEATSLTLITALLHRYASLARETTNTAYLSLLFEPSGTISLPDGRILHSTQINDITGPSPPKLLRHHVTTLDIQFLAEHEAEFQAYVVAGTDVKMPDHWGRWDGRVRRSEGGRWVIGEMRVLVDGMDGKGWVAGVMGG